MDVEGRLAGLVRVGRQGGQNINHGVDEAAMTAVLDLLDGLERVVNGFDDGALAKKSLYINGMGVLRVVLRSVVISCHPRSHRS